MMDGYLGEFPVTGSGGMDDRLWALYFISHFGQFDGAHHKAWVLDQVARILLGTEVIAAEARWDNGEKEIRVKTAEPPSEKYLEWVKDMCAGEDGPDTYEYYEGWAP